MALHPFIIEMLKALKDMPALSAGTPEAGRAFVAAARSRLGTGPEMASCWDVALSGSAGDIPLRLLIPKGDVAGVIVFLHGGGWVLGALDDYDTYMRTLADRSGCAVVGVGYRLAPEHPFPAGLTDCEEALTAVLQGALPGLPAGPVVVMGDSAGGNLATACCARLQDRSQVALQVLYYPVTDADFDRPSYKKHGQGLPLTAQDMRWFFNHYAPPAMWTDPSIAVLTRSDLAGMPPAIIITAEHDVLCDEGEDYAARLQHAGNSVSARRVPGVTHGFIRLHRLFDVADAELSTISEEIRKAVAA